jgi:glutathione reductase (NADPH)
MVYASDFQKEIRERGGLRMVDPLSETRLGSIDGKYRQEVARLEAAYTSAIEKSGARLVKERATFQDARTLRLSNGETVRARNILIATGSTPNHGEVLPGLEHVISSDKVFELRELPRRIIIQGGGYIAVEFACIFAGLGSKVTLVCRSDNILRGFDKDIRTHVRDALEQQEIRIVTGCQIKRVDRINESSGVLKASLSNTEQLIADQIMFAIGRKPNTQDLNLRDLALR